jgi:hypothetical protein
MNGIPIRIPLTKGEIVQPTYALIDNWTAEANVAGRSALFIIVLTDSLGSGRGSE